MAFTVIPFSAFLFALMVVFLRFSFRATKEVGYFVWRSQMPLSVANDLGRLLTRSGATTQVCLKFNVGQGGVVIVAEVYSRGSLSFT